MLEPDERKRSRPVLRGERERKLPDLLGKNEMLHLYEEKDITRAQVNRCAEERLRELVSQIRENDWDPILTQQITALSARLKTVTGKKQYGYLRPEVKRMVNDIAARLAADPLIDEMYRHWCDLNAEIRRLYTDEIPEPVALVGEKTFRTIKNMIVRCAVAMAEPTRTWNAHTADVLPENTEDIPPPYRSEIGEHIEETIRADGQESGQIPVAQPKIQQEHAAPASVISPAANLLMQLARMIHQDYENKQIALENAVDRKLMQRIRHKQQDMGQKLE